MSLKPLKIFHTGDIHIGMKFLNYPEGVRQKLSKARFLVLENMIEKANQLNADLFVVAGDLFNNIKISKKDIKRAVSAINGFGGYCSLVLPGNHDYDNGTIELWQEFSDLAGSQVLLLNEKKVYDLEDYGVKVKVFAAPCHSKHSKENSLGWMQKQTTKRGEDFHIGIAHGAIEGLSPDLEGNYYYMSMEELNSIPMDLWLLGHTHVSWPENKKVQDQNIFNPGSPEADGLDFKGEATAWFIELSKEKILGEKIRTGKYQFIDKEFVLEKFEDLERIKTWATEGDGKSKLIRLSLQGYLAKEDYEQLSEFYTELGKELLHLIIKDEELKIRIDKAVIENEFSEGSFPYEFLNSLSHDEEALQLAYELLK